MLLQVNVNNYVIIKLNLIKFNNVIIAYPIGEYIQILDFFNVKSFNYFLIFMMFRFVIPFKLNFKNNKNIISKYGYYFLIN